MELTINGHFIFILLVKKDFLTNKINIAGYIQLNLLIRNSHQYRFLPENIMTLCN